MNDLSATRLNWRPTPDDWIKAGRAYCRVFETAMWAATASDASRTLAAVDSMDFDEKLVSLVEAADRRVVRAYEALTEKLPVAGFENIGEQWTLKRRSDDVEYEQAERDRIVSAHRAAEKTARDAKTNFRSLMKNDKEVAGFAEKHRLRDIEEWARKGRNWQLEITDRVQLYHERTMEMKALEYRKNIADAARALADAINAPLDPHARLLALSDIRRHGSIEPDALQSSISEVAILALAARKASDEFAEEVGEAFVGGSPWWQFVLNLQSFAKRNGLPWVVGTTTPKRDGRYSDFVEFAWSMNETLPEHIRCVLAKSTFVKDAKTAQKKANKFAEETKRLRDSEPEAILPVHSEK